MTILEIKNLSYFYEKPLYTDITSDRKIQALKNISFRITQASITIILGPSGSGKTTLLDVLSTLKEPTAGTILFIEEGIIINPYELDTNQLQSFRSKHIGYLNQNLKVNLIEQLSFKQNIEIFQILSGLKKIQNDQLNQLLERLKLSKNIINIQISKLSGGEKQRLSLIFLLLRRPEFLFLDEPTSFLDQASRALVVKLIKEFQEKERITFFISSHDPYLAKIGDTLYYINEGIINKNKGITDLAETYAKIEIEGSYDSEKGIILIPIKIFSNLQTNQFYIIEGSSTIDLRIANETDLKSGISSNWVYINSDNPVIKIPDQFKSLFFNSKSLMWVIQKNTIQIKIIH
jgi:ABC-type multidrug transport system ATPase subunit